ncbi:hypothetical protein [Streptomyces sp. NPDC048611]|uniref:hypothetical protein n=1 Tax=Streptomyces sp. NPDC048611 TaxID=3155635 RepID=UPI0034158B3F
MNVTVLPPLRYRSAEHGIRTLAHALCDLVSDVCPALRERGLDKWSADEDRYRYGAFLVGYAEFLESLSRITRVFADLDEDRLGDQVRRFDELADRAQNCRRQLADR